MRHYCAQVSTATSGGAVVVDLGECPSPEAAREKFDRFGLCLHSEKIVVEIVEYEQLMGDKTEKECPK